ncbi:nucleotidyl cyclase domain-containing protein [Kineosporia babensis]|uniref:Guanylate cyclase domain-containing protein n=1 Tax=Kineosporia babensis TaxID=499548 RepID=A0A9X1STP2_9ACTN|nr:hypothetical protein [Kineosporia babensis]MCD5312057.1 hypothetical protein [Kineosporia babensis]
MFETDDILAHRELTGPGHQGDGDRGRAQVPSTSITYPRPLLYRLPPSELPPALQRRVDDQGVQYVGLILACRLSAPEKPWTYARAGLQVILNNARARVVSLNEGEWPASDGADHFGLLTHEFGWMFRPHEKEGWSDYVRQAVVEAPGEETEVGGRLEGEAVLTKGVARRTVLTQAGDPVTFCEPISGEQREGATRVVITLDVVGYSRHRTSGQDAVQKRLLWVAEEALKPLALGNVFTQDAGDGLQLVLPAGADESVAIPTFYRALVAALDQVHAELGEGESFQIRIGMARGHTAAGVTGVRGQAAVLAARLCDCAQAREAIRDSGADFVLTVSAELYEDVVKQAGRHPRPASFTPIRVVDEGKHLDVQAWLHRP